MKITDLRCEYMRNLVLTDRKTPLFSWVIESEKRNTVQTSYRLLVSDNISRLDGKSANLCPKGDIESNESMSVCYYGKALKPFTKYYWRVIVKNNHGETAVSDIASFLTGRFDTRFPAKWIGKQEKQGKKRNAGAKSPYLFKRFTLNKEIKEAFLFATAKGVYDAKINGKELSRAVLSPGWTDFDKTFYYQGYEITEHLNEGENAIGVALGDGWYFGNLSAVGRNQYGNYPRLFAAFILVKYADGTSEKIITDSSWCAGEGPIRYADLQTGEFYDANLELKDFATVGFDESAFTAVTVRTLKEEPQAQKGELIEKQEEIVPVSYNTVRGKHIFDMGQNMVGRVRLKVKGSKGKKIRLRYGEMLNTDKSLYTANLRSCEATDYYICKSDDFETWEATFTVHGFRYVEISGMDYIPSLDAVIGVVIHNGLTKTGSFNCNDGLVNKLFQNAYWGQKGNFLAVPTDCPQRDERLGWTGDSQIFCQSGCYNMYSEAFYEKYIRDVMDAQYINGAFTDIAPYIHWPNQDPLVGYGNAAWGDAGVIMPWLMYKNYGNVRILEECYPNIVRYIDLLEQTTVDDIRTPICYGDWLCVGTPVPFPVIDTLYMIYVTDLAVNMSKLLGREEEAKRFEGYLARYRKGFLKHCVNEETGEIDGDTQTGYVLALRFNAAPNNDKLNEKFAINLIKAMERANNHLTTGFVGVKELLPVLCEIGRADIAYKLLLNRTYPSWLYSVVNGATTIWERWNSFTLEDGFADIRMNSFNHYSLGSVTEWLYGYVGGMRNFDPAWSHFEIAPEISSLEFANVIFESPKGKIESSWRRVGNGYEIKITVPANTAATLKLPASENAKICEMLTGEKLAFAFENGKAVTELGSGEYLFKIKE
ncbi:MAG: family 78 glycoside hydrolase catalytic domain [Clostridia bacterium]|nr:family 78 glycoside hydrolase catalytic domain [Clostridia bacterium]